MDAGDYAGFSIAIHEPGIAVFTFNQPDRLNGMSVAMKRDLTEALLQAQLDDSVRVVVFTGSGRAFCAGDDLKAYGTEEGGGARRMPPIPRGHTEPITTYGALRGVSQALNRAVRDLDKLSIAAINGVAIQTGFSLALACDFRIASTTAKLGSATLRFALLPDEGGQYLLVQHMGAGRAMDFLMRKRIVSADEALQLGLVGEVTPPEQLMERTMELARELADGPQVAMRLLKRSIYNAAHQTFDQACEDIAAKTAITDHHRDAREGIRAFKEKRAARFNQPPPK